MATLMGGLKGNRGEITRLGNKSSGISAWLRTWKTKIYVIMDADDTIRIRVSSVDNETLPKVFFQGKCIYNPTKNKQRRKIMD